jgi:thermostable 8-oxoguanine DNA glycosylase
MKVQSSDPTQPEQLNQLILGEFEMIAAPFFSRAEVLFQQKRLAACTAKGVWCELVYCILAGSQVPIETARRSHEALCNLWVNPALPDDPKLDVELSTLVTSLKSTGYRYYRTKAQVIYQAALFVSGDLASDPRSLFLSDPDPRAVERRLRAGVKGIGRKIANHWMRNVGLDTCTVDIHLKRLFKDFGLFHGDPEGTTSDVEFDQILAHVRDLARYLGRPLGETQFALWLGARERFGRTLRDSSESQQPSLF